MFFFDKRLRSFQSNISSQLWWNRWGFEPAPERACTETPVQFTDSHDNPMGPIDVHGNPMAPTPGRQWSIADNEKKS